MNTKISKVHTKDLGERYRVPMMNFILAIHVEKKYSVILVKDGKAGFIQNHCDRYKDHCNGILQ